VLEPTLAKTSEKVQNCHVATEVQWSELQRDPKSVAALVDKGDVRVRRRDGVALLLTQEDRLAATAEGAVLAARALRSLVAHLPQEVIDAAANALADEFPWLDLLPEADRAQFVVDFARAFQASAEIGQWSTLAQTIKEWRSTAAVHADPTLARQLTEPIGEGADFGPVPSPAGSE
jgi:hypothetical protein